MGANGRLIAAILVVAAVAIGFWMLLLGPQREKADELGGQVEQLTTAVETARSEVVQATAAQRSFPADYRQLVVLGQAAPAGDETASLLVELEQIAKATGVSFKSIELEGGSETATAPPAVTATAPPTEASTGTSSAVPAAATVPATEMAASLLPLGASIGPAGLDVMPYGLEFSGNFFQISRFISSIDSLVKPGSSQVAVDGRLLTIDGFSLSADPTLGFPQLSATFSVTSYLTPPGQGITAGATATAPPTAAPASSEASPPAAEGAAPASSETVAAR